MGGNNTRRADAKRAEKEARRAAIAKQYNIPMSAMETSKPNQLGRSMFLSTKDADKFFSAMKGRDPKIDRNDPTTWNPKKD